MQEHRSDLQIVVAIQALMGRLTAQQASVC